MQEKKESWTWLVILGQPMHDLMTWMHDPMTCVHDPMTCVHDPMTCKQSIYEQLNAIEWFKEFEDEK